MCVSIPVLLLSGCIVYYFYNNYNNRSISDMSLIEETISDETTVGNTVLFQTAEIIQENPIIIDVIPETITFGFFSAVIFFFTSIFLPLWSCLININFAIEQMFVVNVNDFALPEISSTAPISITQTDRILYSNIPDIIAASSSSNNSSNSVEISPSISASSIDGSISASCVDGDIPNRIAVSNSTTVEIPMITSVSASSISAVDISTTSVSASSISAVDIPPSIAASSNSTTIIEIPTSSSISESSRNFTKELPTTLPATRQANLRSEVYDIPNCLTTIFGIHASRVDVSEIPPQGLPEILSIFSSYNNIDDIVCRMPEIKQDSAINVIDPSTNTDYNFFEELEVPEIAAMAAIAAIPGVSYLNLNLHNGLIDHSVDNRIAPAIKVTQLFKYIRDNVKITPNDYAYYNDNCFIIKPLNYDDIAPESVAVLSSGFVVSRQLISDLNTNLLNQSTCDTLTNLYRSVYSYFFNYQNKMDSHHFIMHGLFSEVLSNYAKASQIALLQSVAVNPNFIKGNIGKHLHLLINKKGPESFYSLYTKNNDISRRHNACMEVAVEACELAAILNNKCKPLLTNPRCNQSILNYAGVPNKDKYNLLGLNTYFKQLYGSYLKLDRLVAAAQFSGMIVQGLDNIDIAKRMSALYATDKLLLSVFKSIRVGKDALVKTKYDSVTGTKSYLFLQNYNVSDEKTKVYYKQFTEALALITTYLEYSAFYKDYMLLNYIKEQDNRKVGLQFYGTSVKSIDEKMPYYLAQAKVKALIAYEYFMEGKINYLQFFAQSINKDLIWENQVNFFTNAATFNSLLPSSLVRINAFMPQIIPSTSILYFPQRETFSSPQNKFLIESTKLYKLEFFLKPTQIPTPKKLYYNFTGPEFFNQECARGGVINPLFSFFDKHKPITVSSWHFMKFNCTDITKNYKVVYYLEDQHEFGVTPEKPHNINQTYYLGHCVWKRGIPYLVDQYCTEAGPTTRIWPKGIYNYIDYIDYLDNLGPAYHVRIPNYEQLWDSAVRPLIERPSRFSDSDVPYDMLYQPFHVDDHLMDPEWKQRHPNVKGLPHIPGKIIPRPNFELPTQPRVGPPLSMCEPCSSTSNINCCNSSRSGCSRSIITSSSSNRSKLPFDIERPAWPAWESTWGFDDIERANSLELSSRNIYYIFRLPTPTTAKHTNRLMVRSTSWNGYNEMPQSLRGLYSEYRAWPNLSSSLVTQSSRRPESSSNSISTWNSRHPEPSSSGGPVYSSGRPESSSSSIPTWNSRRPEPSSSGGPVYSSGRPTSSSSY